MNIREIVSSLAALDAAEQQAVIIAADAARAANAALAAIAPPKGRGGRPAGAKNKPKEVAAPVAAPKAAAKSHKRNPASFSE